MGSRSCYGYLLKEGAVVPVAFPFRSPIWSCSILMRDEQPPAIGYYILRPITSLIKGPIPNIIEIDFIQSVTRKQFAIIHLPNMFYSVPTAFFHNHCTIYTTRGVQGSSLSTSSPTSIISQFFICLFYNSQPNRYEVYLIVVLTYISLMVCDVELLFLYLLVILLTSWESPLFLFKSFLYFLIGLFEGLSAIELQEFPIYFE